MNVYWLISLICSLSAALLATLVQQWVRAYMRIYQRSSNPLKTARIQVFLYESVEHLPVVAEAVPGFIHLSLILFFLGLADTVLNINTSVGVTTMIPIIICGFLYLYCTVAPIVNPQSPYRNPFSSFIWRLIRDLYPESYNYYFRDRVDRPLNIDGVQERLAMEQTEGRKARDVRAIQWLIDNVNGSNDMDAFVLAIPGSFNQDLGREIWKEVTTQGISRPDVEGAGPTQPGDVQVHPLHGLREGTPIYDICRCVRSVIGTYNHGGDSMNKETRRRRMHGCIETAAALVCCTGVQLDWFGDVGEVLSELGHTEGTNEPPTIRTYPSFIVRWTCLSLVSVRQMVKVEGNRVRQLAGFAVSGIARFQSDYGEPDALALKGAQKIDNYLKKAWEHVEDLHRAFEPWSLNRTGEEIKDIICERVGSISDLERIEGEAEGIGDVDWRMSLLQDAMETATHKLIRQLPGLAFHELKSAGPIMMSEAFDFPLAGVTPVTPQVIFPGQQLQALCTLGRRLRDIIEGWDPEKHQEILEGLKSIDKIPVLLRRLNHLMKRQLRRLQDLRDGGGFGFTVELFFLALRQLSSASLSDESKKGFYVGTFKVITTQATDSKHSFGTQGILLDLICDIVIRSRGIFSDFAYPEYIVKELVELVKKTVDGQAGSRIYINEAVRELQEVKPRDCMDEGIREMALTAITLSLDRPQAITHPIASLHPDNPAALVRPAQNFAMTSL